MAERRKHSFPFPEFDTVDMTHITSVTDLERELKRAFADYEIFLEKVRRDQQAWARRRLNFVQDNDKDAEKERELTTRRLYSQEFWPRYRNLLGVDDTMIPALAGLFAYSNKERVERQVASGGLRISAGVVPTQSHQRGTFPRGAYGTTIKPYQTDVSLHAMRLEFYDIEYGIPEYVPQVQEVPLTHWVAFLPSTGFRSRGNLRFTRIATNSHVDFGHYSLPTPDLNPDTIIPYDIIAFGCTLIPENKSVMTVRRNTTTENERVPLLVSPLEPSHTGPR